MSDAAAQNPFTPPRARVEGAPVVDSTALVDATRVSRLLAVLLDMSPVIVFYAVLDVMAGPGVLSGRMAGIKLNAGDLLALVLLVVAVLIVEVVWSGVLLHRYGQTIGKKVMGLRVVRVDGRRASFARLFVLRWFMMAFVAWIADIAAPSQDDVGGCGVWLVDALFIAGPGRRCLHDLIAGTRVVTAESSQHATLAASRAVA